MILISVLSIISELLSVALFSGYFDLSVSAAGFVLIHVISCAVFSYCMNSFVPKKVRISDKRSFLFMLAVTSLVPLLGIFGILISVVYAMRNPLHQVEKSWIMHKKEELPSNPRNMLYTKFGTGALRDILLNSPSVDRRVEAITSISRLPRAQRIAFYKMALRDSSDDVRLLAYSQLDPVEQQITDNIKILAEGFKNNENADTAFDISQQFWELCYLGISEGALFNHYIHKALEWCQIAIRLEAKPNYSLLLGKIYLSLDKTDLAYEALKKAYDSRMLTSQVLPYLAECAFKKHEYAKVREILNDLGTSGAGKLTQIKEYWCETVQ